MAAALSLACDPIASWYHFDYSLSWSNNCEVAEVLSDIPFLSVGILVFGVSVLFLVFKRVSLSAACLFFSALLAFIAAVLDLGQTLSTTSKHNQPAIRAREVLFAFSTGLRFLFYWSYVAEAPLKAQYAASIQTVRRINFFTFECTQRSEPHSRSRMRWGRPGRLLGVSLLASIIIITALQIVWRVVPQFHQYSNVYAADTVLELVVSFLLLLKLLGNVTLDSPDSILVHTFRECLAPIFGLLVNIVIGVGDLLYFAFTESTVGRILQAFEVYIITVFVVITALLSHCHIPTPTASSQGETRSDAVFTLPRLPRESTLRIVPPVIETPRMSMALRFATQNKESSRGLHRLAPPSLNRVSSWISSRISRSRPHHEDEEVKLWNAKEAEAEPGRKDTQLRASTVLITHEPKERTEPTYNASADRMAVTFDSDDQSKTARSTEGSIHTSQTVHPCQADAPQRTVPLEARTSFVHSSLGLPSATSGAKQTANMTPPLDASPVYGSGGIQSLANTSDLRTSLDELLSQQSQLDRSIEALKLFSARTSTDLPSSNYVQNSKSVKLTRSSSIGQRTTCSEVSLSSFPIPPWLTNPVPSPPPPRLPSTMRIREDRRVRYAAARSTPIRDTSPRSSGTTHALLVETDKHLSVDVGKDSADPGETRYNVTSFIGATLDEPRQEMALSLQTPVMSYAEEDMSLPPIRPVQRTGSPIAVPTEGVDQVQKMFVRPRPPPLAVQSYSMPRIQVVADD